MIGKYLAYRAGKAVGRASRPSDSPPLKPWQNSLDAIFFFIALGLAFYYS